MYHFDREETLEQVQASLERVFPVALAEMYEGPWRECADALAILEDPDLSIPFDDTRLLTGDQLDDFAGADDYTRTYVRLKLHDAAERMKWCDVEPLEQHVQSLLADVDGQDHDDGRVAPTLRHLAERWAVPQYMELWDIDADEWTRLLDEMEPHLEEADWEPSDEVYMQRIAA